jgi:hypothetical protein
VKNYPFVLLAIVLLTACTEKLEHSNVVPSRVAPTASQTTASGFVFHDLNKNMIKDDNEPGIPGVAVSNGTEVVQTDQNGQYALPVDFDNALFVIKPTGWMTPVNSAFLPQFYYLHKPKGSPADIEYKGLAPTGPLPASVDFPLHQREENNPFKILVFGDTQPYSDDQIDFVAEDIIHELIGRDDYVFGMTMGDIVGDSLGLLDPLNSAIALLEHPWYYVLGNHDLNFDVEEDIYSDETFERVYGPPTYAFEVGNVHFFVLDNVIYPKDKGGHGYIGGLRDDQFLFIKNYLKTVPPGELIVLTMHIPLNEVENWFRQEDLKRLMGLFADHPHTLSISAHTHMQKNYFFGKGQAGWKHDHDHHHYNAGTTSGSWWMGDRDEVDIPHTMMRDGTPNGYAIITFSGNTYEIDWKVARRPEDYKMNIHVPRQIKHHLTKEIPLSVNYFLGSDKTVVQFRINQAEKWTTMTKIDDIDPYFLMREDKLPNPQPSTHLWRSNIGGQWPAGRHLIEVKVTDLYKREFRQFHSFRVMPAKEAE